MDIGDRIKQMRKQAGLSQAELAYKMSQRGSKVMTDSAISKWERGYTEPTVEQALTICEVCGFPDVQRAFFGGPLDATNAIYNRLNLAGKQQLRDYLDYLISSSKYTAKPVDDGYMLQRTIRLFDMPASAGLGIDLEGEDYTEIEVDNTVPSEASFAVRLSGDSMEPRFLNGQIVFVRQADTLSNGDIGIVALNGNAFCKRITEQGLESINPRYTIIKVGLYDSFHVFGQVIG